MEPLGSGLRDLSSAAVYRRTIRASLERVWENVRDWEHLPWLHGGSFSAIERVDSGAWGWRARVGLVPREAGQDLLLELRLDLAELRYVTRTLEGPGKGTEIWTRLEPAGPETGIEVEFLLPGVSRSQREALGGAFTALYARLWDEDEAMMMTRERHLSEGRGRARDSGSEQRLGSLAEVRARLPLCVAFAGQTFRIVEVDGDLISHSAVCPHWLGPLVDAPVEEGRIRCPWHGYAFDLRSGASCDGRGLRLPRAPKVEVDAASGDVWLRG